MNLFSKRVTEKIQIFPPMLHIPSRSAYHLCRPPFIFNVFLATAPSGNEVFLFTFCPIFLLTFLSDWQCASLPTHPSFPFRSTEINFSLSERKLKHQTLTSTVHGFLKNMPACSFSKHHSIHFPGVYRAPLPHFIHLDYDDQSFGSWVAK